DPTATDWRTPAAPTWLRQGPRAPRATLLVRAGFVQAELRLAPSSQNRVVGAHLAMRAEAPHSTLPSVAMSTTAGFRVPRRGERSGSRWRESTRSPEHVPTCPHETARGRTRAA